MQDSGIRVVRVGESEAWTNLPSSLKPASSQANGLFLRSHQLHPAYPPNRRSSAKPAQGLIRGSPCPARMRRRPRPRLRPLGGRAFSRRMRAVESGALGPAHAYARGGASWERELSSVGRAEGVHSRLGPRASLPQLSSGRPWAEAVARPGCGAGSPSPVHFCAIFRWRPEGVGGFDLGPGKALNLLIVVV